MFPINEGNFLAFDLVSSFDQNLLNNNQRQPFLSELATHILLDLFFGYATENSIYIYLGFVALPSDVEAFNWTESNVGSTFLSLTPRGKIVQRLYIVWKYVGMVNILHVENTVVFTTQGDETFSDLSSSVCLHVS